MQSIELQSILWLFNICANFYDLISIKKKEAKKKIFIFKYTSKLDIKMNGRKTSPLIHWVWGD